MAQWMELSQRADAKLGGKLKLYTFSFYLVLLAIIFPAALTNDSGDTLLIINRKISYFNIDIMSFCRVGLALV